MAWTEAQAQKAAARSGARVEVAGKSTASDATWANPDGTFTRETHAQPYRVRRGGNWVPIDTTMVQNPDGSVGPKAAATAMRFSGGGDMPLATVSRAGRVMSISWPGGLPAPMLSGDTATYALADDLDLVVRASATGYSHVLVVQSPAALKDSRLTTIRYGLNGKDLKFTATEDRLQAIDASTGGLVFEAPAPKMWDAGDPAERASGVAATQMPHTAIRASMSVRVKGQSLTLVPDPQMLSRSDLRFPLYLDPFTNPTSNSAWAMVDSGYPDEEYWKFDGERDERIGMCNVGDANSHCNDSEVKRLLYALPTPYQNDSISVLGASFKITMIHTYDGSARNASLYRMGSGITSATNWRNQPAWSKWQDTRNPTVSRDSCTSTNQNVTFTATQAVQDAAKYNWSTTTFGIRSDNESSKLFIKHFCDNAVLSVNYNRPPAAPTTLTSNPGGGCHTGTPNNSWYVSSVPKLSAYLADPDGADDEEPLTARFTVTWTPAGGTLQTKQWVSGTKANKSTFDYNLATPTTGVPNLPENVVVSWYVEASDGTTWSAKSVTCGFILDKTKPTGADIDSPEYLMADAADATPACVEEDEWIAGVGRYGTFTFDSAATDVVYYKYGFDASPTTVLTPATNGGPVSVSWIPLTEAPHFVNVIAVDVAGKESDVSSCTFRVGPGAAPVGQWKLDDLAGSAQAADSVGTSPATVGSGVTFEYAGPGGPAHRSALLDGSDAGYLTTSNVRIVDTSKPFTVGAWVKINDLSTTAAAVSQDGTGEPGFVLGYSATTNKWTFRMAATDLDTISEWSVSSAGQATTAWTHLAGAFDPYTKTIQIYVNGHLSGSGSARSAWASHGRLQIGRQTSKTGYTATWHGGIADVAVHGRLLIPSEISLLAEPRLQRQVYWAMDSNVAIDDSPGTWSISEDVSEGAQADPAKDLTLHDADGLYTPDLDNEPWLEYPLVGAGHMNLNGTDEYASTSLPLVGTTGSYSVTTRAKLAADCTSNQVVLSQPGVNVSRFVVRCADIGGGQRRWQLAMAETDSATTAWTVVTNDLVIPDPADTDGSHLAVVYNAIAERVQLYVDGQLTAAANVPHHAAEFGADKGLQVGRALTGPQSYGSYFSGVLDEVRVYAGALDPVTIIRLASLTPQSDI
ncbi:LamG domain-containing protein [Asanoa sp. NPDC049518]|uniref:LamG domain-containing protein n=1 Tax=Asanoa sp. NPDC049518 TaxID=3155503 RepID=UPI0034485C64